MRSVPLLFAVVVALVFAVLAWQPADAPAAAAVKIVITTTDTLVVPEGFGGVSIQARNGDVGVRLLGGPFEVEAAEDSIPLFQNQWLNLDLYARLRVFPGRLMSGIAVYIEAGDTVRGIYW